MDKAPKYLKKKIANETSIKLDCKRVGFFFQNRFGVALECQTHEARERYAPVASSIFSVSPQSCSLFSNSIF